MARRRRESRLPRACTGNAPRLPANAYKSLQMTTPVGGGAGGGPDSEALAEAEGGAGVSVRILHVGLRVIAASEEAGLTLLVERHR